MLITVGARGAADKKAVFGDGIELLVSLDSEVGNIIRVFSGPFSGGKYNEVTRGEIEGSGSALIGELLKLGVCTLMPVNCASERNGKAVSCCD